MYLTLSFDCLIKKCSINSQKHDNPNEKTIPETLVLFLGNYQMIELPGSRWAGPPGQRGRPPWGPEVIEYYSNTQTNK